VHLTDRLQLGHLQPGQSAGQTAILHNAARKIQAFINR
jgi:hypothetical protein